MDTPIALADVCSFAELARWSILQNAQSPV